MLVEKTPLADLLLIRPRVFHDARGYFLETWHAHRYDMAGISLPFVQDNHSRSCLGVLRGLHFQRRHPQGKLVRCSAGRIFDVNVDIRPHSPSYGQWWGVELSGENHCQLWVPPGFAHGFCVLSDVADMQYKCTSFYDPADEGSIRWDDPDLGIVWPRIATPWIVSDKDAAAPRFAERAHIPPLDSP